MDRAKGCGEGMPFKKGLSLKYTDLGYAIHHAPSVFWAMFHESIRNGSRQKNAQRCSNSSAKRLEQPVIAIEKSSP
jgi:hypothetical protein